MTEESANEERARPIAVRGTGLNDHVLQAIFDQTLSPMGLLDQDFRFVAVNAAYCRLFDCEPSDTGCIARGPHHLHPSVANRTRRVGYHRPMLRSLTSPVRSGCMPIEHVLVVVPACDEEDTIRGCLDSVDAARAELAVAVSSTIVVVADSCRDRTLAIARDAMHHRGDIAIESTARRAGDARHLATEVGLIDLDIPLERVWIANTDADTLVPPEWLTVQLAIADTGVIGVAGVVELDPGTNPDLALVDSFARSYLVHPDGSHPHVHGANLGFRADAYRAAGGWNPLATGEDHDLWNRLRACGSVVSTSGSRVRTSARLVGRAPAGFAADLAMLDALALVSGVDAVA